MANTTALSNIKAPAGVLTPGGGGGGGGSSDARVTLGSLRRPMKGVHTVDAANGPITGDTFIQAGTPSMTGRTLYTWDNINAFNTQSQNWIAAPEGTDYNNSGYSACMNAVGPRVYGSTIMDGFPMESNIDFGFVTEALTVTFIYYNFGGATGNGYHDNQIYIEDETTGNLKKMSRMPATKTSTGMHFRTVSFKEARQREFRIMLAMNSWFIGVAIENPYTIRKSPNKLLFCYNGDSWGEPWGSVLAAPVGGTYPSGTYRVAYTPQMLAEEWGAAVCNIAQSGTGYFNAGSGARKEETAIYNQGTFNNCSVFFGESRINNYLGRIAARNPILFTVGGWNDGAIVNSPFAADMATRVTSGINRVIAGQPDAQMLFAGIQPVHLNGYVDEHSGSNLGIRDAVTNAPQENIVGYINQWEMWPDRTMSGQRGDNVNSSDQIHLTSKGAVTVNGWWATEMAEMSIPLDYYLGMLAYEHPSSL